MQDLYVTTSIPYVNGAPHLGHALEIVHADVLARHRRSRGAAARVQSGTDDHALKNVAAARAAGLPIADLVRRNGDRFETLVGALGAHVDAFVRTSSHPGHADAVRQVWRRCAASGDLRRRSYRGLYCAGCEEFRSPGDVPDGLCPEHGAAVEELVETNWFFRLSRYSDDLHRLVASGRVDVVPAARRHEVLGFLAGGLEDVSVSRPADRAGGWGVPVPDDPGQVVYVWFDALVNYLTGLGFPGPDGAGSSWWPDAGWSWWSGAAERAHVVGKGIARFHAVLWPAVLLSAGLPLPDRVLVHDYLTVDGAKIAKSGAQAADPAGLAERFGADAVRWWLLREPAPLATTDFTVERLVEAHDRDLANGFGNLLSRTLALAAKRPGGVEGVEARAYGARTENSEAVALAAATRGLASCVDAAVQAYDLRAACVAVTDLVARTGSLLGRTEPWRLAAAATTGDDAAGTSCDVVLSAALQVCRVVADELSPFVPDGAARARAVVAAGLATEPVFPRSESVARPAPPAGRRVGRRHPDGVRPRCV